VPGYPGSSEGYLEIKGLEAFYHGAPIRMPTDALVQACMAAKND